MIKVKYEGNYYNDRNVGPDYAKDEYGVLVYDDVEEAHKALTDPEGWFCLEHDGDGVYSLPGVYETAHGQHSRPSYTLVNARTGKSNKAIRAAANNKNK